MTYLGTTLICPLQRNKAREHFVQRMGGILVGARIDEDPQKTPCGPIEGLLWAFERSLGPVGRPGGA